MASRLGRSAEECKAHYDLHYIDEPHSSLPSAFNSVCSCATEMCMFSVFMRMCVRVYVHVGVSICVRV